MSSNQTKSQKPSEYIYTIDTPAVCLEIVTAFNALTCKEKQYAHYLSKAMLFGSLIVLCQTSTESPLIFALLHRLFSMQPMDELKALALNNVKLSEQEWKAFLVYVAAIYSNMGNYRGIGDTKFIPDLPNEKLEQLIKCSKAYKHDSTFIDFVWNNSKDKIFSLRPDELSLGFPPKGTTKYWSKNMTEGDEKIVTKFFSQNNIDAYNTRVMRDSKTGEYIIRFASILGNSDSNERDYMDKISNLEIDGYRFRLERGDYSPLLCLVNKYLEKAKCYAGNNIEKIMIEEYIRHFRSGSLDAHKQGSRYWVRDKQPIVETYIGFIENYRDPAGQRAEFEGFVTILNKEMSKKFTDLVDNATKLLPLLPWPRDFEKDQFLHPDFTSLDLLIHCGSTTPFGINIPNYDEIRQNDNFKNFSLGNVINASSKVKPNFLSDNDVKIFDKYATLSFEIKVGLHELLGHGSGKLLKANEDGTLNFDPKKTINPLTGKPVDKWYQYNESYDSKFASLGSSYEECRAECVGLYLSSNEDVLNIFGFTDPAEAKKLVYTFWLDMVYKGIKGLNMYSTSTKKWLQAHSQARYVITRVLLESVKEMISIEYIEKSLKDEKPDLLITLTNDLDLIKTKGREAIGKFLLKLQVYKSTGDIENAQNMFDYYSKVTDELEYPYLKFRDVVIARKKPRRLFVKPSIQIVDSSSVQLKTFEPSHEGLIQSFQENLKDELCIDSILVDLWKKDAIYFN